MCPWSLRKSIGRSGNCQKVKIANLVPRLQFWLKFCFELLISLNVEFLIHLLILFCLSVDESRDISKSKNFQWFFWAKSKNHFKTHNICTLYESTSSGEFKNIFVIEIGYLNRKLANLCNFSGQNDQFRFQKSNMVMWHIKLKLEAHQTFCNYFPLKMKLIVSVILENHFFRKNSHDVIMTHNDPNVFKNCYRVTKWLYAAFPLNFTMV